MSLTGQVLQVLRKDLRRFGWLVAVFVGVLLLDLLVGAELAQRAAGRLAPPGTTTPPTLLLVWVASALLAALVVQEDDVSTRAAFWATRPIEPSALLLAKGIFAGAMLVGVPLAFQSYALLAAGARSELGWHLLQTAVVQGGVVAAGMVAAALTRDLRGAILLALGALLSWQLLSRGLTDGMIPLEVRGARTFAVQLWWLAAAVGLLWWQVLTGGTRVGRLGVGLAVVVALALWTAMPYRTPDRGGSLPVAEAAPEIQVRDILISPLRMGAGAGIRDAVEVVVGTGPSPYAYFPLAQSVRVVSSTGGPLPGIYPRLYNPTQRWVPPLEGYRWLGAHDGWSQFDVRVVAADRALVLPALQRLGALELDARWRVYDRRVLARLPLEAGAEWTEDPVRIRVEGVSFGPASLELTVTTTRVESFLASQRRRAVERYGFVLVNDRRRELAMESSGGSSTTESPLLLGGPRVEVRTYRQQYRYAAEPGAGADRAWLQEAKLLIYANRYLGTVEGGTRFEPVTRLSAAQVAALRLASVRAQASR